MAVDPAGSTYVVGSTMSNFFTVWNPLQPSRGGFPRDAFFAKITNFDVCAQDDETRHTVQFNSSTGGYQFTALRYERYDSDGDGPHYAPRQQRVPER